MTVSPAATDVLDIVHKAHAVAQIVQADLGEAGDRRLRFFDHVDDDPVLDDIDAEALVIFDERRIDQTVTLAGQFGDAAQVGDKDGVVEDDEEIVTGGQIGGGEKDGVGRTEAFRLYHVTAAQLGKGSGHLLGDLLAMLVSDEDEFLDLQMGEAADNMFENRLASDMHQRFGFSMGVWAQTRPFSGDRENNFHCRHSLV